MRKNETLIIDEINYQSAMTKEYEPSLRAHRR